MRGCLCTDGVSRGYVPAERLCTAKNNERLVRRCQCQVGELWTCVDKAKALNVLFNFSSWSGLLYSAPLVCSCQERRFAERA